MTTTTESTIDLDGLIVRCKLVGEGKPPWAERDGAHDWITYEYLVTVVDGSTIYQSSAWGSKMDYDHGRVDMEGIAWMVLDELLSAAYDPDEFWAMALGENPTRESVRKLENLLDSAAAMLPALERNQDAIEDHR